ncbi:LPXTG cell wall anchor domain-containing protein, partial [Limosilactobacillus reuteri]
KPVVNVPVIKDLTDTGDPLVNETKPVANIINYVDPDGNPVKDPDGNPVTKRVSGNPGDPITLDLPKGFHFPNGKTPDIAIDPDKPVVNVPVIKDLTDTGDPLVNEAKPNLNIPIKDTNNSGNQKEDNDQKTNDNDKVQEPVDQININTPSIDLIQPTGKVTDNQSKAKINTSNQKQQEKLPQTGSDSILSTISLGFVSLLSALGLSVSKKRKN